MGAKTKAGYFRREARALRANLGLGLRLLFGRGCDPEAVPATPDQVVWLVVLNLAAGFLVSLLFSQPHPRFNIWGLNRYTLDLGFLLLTGYVIGKRLSAPYSLTRFLVMIYASGVWLFLLWSGVEALLNHIDAAGHTARWEVFAGFLAWAALIALHILGLLNAAGWWRTTQSFALYLLVYLAPTLMFMSAPSFWYRAPTRTHVPDRWAAYQNMDAEALMYAQPHLMHAVLAKLRPQRKGLTDVYFVGFAGYARQDVFRKEVEYTRHLFDTRFDTKGRSVMLINSLKTRNRVPLATATNLKMALGRIGKLMDKNHDVLVLFMTSHGAERPPELDVDFWPLALNQVTPVRLRHDLDAAGIKWRILIVSSCYSGGFVKPLETPYTLITTAAAASRTSFGCSNDNDFTYFGEAFVRDQLSHSFSFISAYSKATAEIHAREQREHLRASLPQLYVGDAMLSKLAALRRTLLAHTCNRQGKPSC